MADPADTPTQRAKEEAVRRVNARSGVQCASVTDVEPTWLVIYELALSIDREGVVFTDEEKAKARSHLKAFPYTDAKPLLLKIAGPEPVDPLYEAMCGVFGAESVANAEKLRAALTEAGYSIVKTALQSGEAK